MASPSLQTAYGFYPVGNYSQAQPSGQLAGPYPRIKSGYQYPIYQGDPVILGSYNYDGNNWLYQPDGYIHSLAEFIALAAYRRAGPVNTLPTSADAINVAQNIPVYGIFKGVCYSAPASVRAINLSATGTNMWPGGMVTAGAADARVMIYNDPAATWQIQTSTTGANAANLGLAYAANFNWFLNPANPALIQAPFIQGNNATGRSMAYLDTSNPSGGGLSRTGSGFLIYDIAPNNEPQEFTVGGNAAPAVPYTSVLVANTNSPFVTKGNAA